MIHYGGFPADDQQLKPLVDAEGHLKTRAPRWFLAKIQPAILEVINGRNPFIR
jgi:hypothetical protein